jgi:Thermolysin metallopeptidase, alpha-helical domain/Concanavalin A-like lectin/glucanases superfamily/Secretion system C-terminal sorting domain
MVSANNGNGGLIYQGESGALNESFSDIFGTCVEFNNSATPNWQIGEGVTIKKPFLRSMSNPKTSLLQYSYGLSSFDERQPNTYKKTLWQSTSSNDDYGGVHTNSGVQNYWFYLLCQGGSGTNDNNVAYNVTGIGIAAAQKIVYRSLTTYLSPRSTYLDAFYGSLQAAIDSFGKNSTQYIAVRKAWQAVGVDDASLQDLTTGLIAYYPFNGNANDESGNSKDGVVNGATLTTDRFGVTNKAYSFNGTNNFIALNHSYSGMTEISVAAWYKINGATNDYLQAILSSDGIAKLIHLQINTSTGGDDAIYIDNTNSILLSLTPQPLNQWKQVIITVKSGDSRLYVNGVQAAQSNTTYSVISPTNLLRIGSGYLNGRFFNGILDDIRIYNRALTSTEVAQLYNSEVPTTNPSITISSGAYNCTTGTIKYTATALNACSNPTYTWVKNGQLVYVANTSTILNSNVYNATGILPNDSVWCYVTTNCSVIKNYKSNTIKIPTITTPAAITGSATVCVGSSIQLSNTTPNGVWSSVAGRATVSNTGLVTGTSAGIANIRYTITNAIGCSAYSTALITSNAIPPVPNIGYAPSNTVNPQAGATGGTGLLMCKNKTFIVRGTPSTGVWATTGGITATSINTQDATVSTISTGAASLKYTYTDANVCSNYRTITATVVTCAAKGIANEQLATRTNFIIYPNPAKNSITINTINMVAGGQIIITNLLGKQLKNQTLSLSNNMIDITNLSKGLYFVSIITNEGIQTQKLVIE